MPTKDSIYDYLPSFLRDDTPPCAETDPEAFFPEPGNSSISKPALKVCAGCPMRQACFEYAYDNRELGIWGGTTERTRRLMREGKIPKGLPQLR